MAEQNIDDGDISAEDLKSLLKKTRDEKAELEGRVSTAESRATQAETERAATAKKLTSTAQETYDARLSAFTGELAAAEAESDRLESEMAAANEAGNYKEAAKIARQIGLLGGKIDRIGYQKEYLESQKDTILKAPEPRQADSDPLSVFSAPTRSWIGRHPKFMSDMSYHNRVIGYHNLALADGLSADSAEYFAYIEKGLGEGYNDTERTNTRDKDARSNTETDDEPEIEIEKPRQPEKPMSTPVTRGGTPAGNRSSGPVRLTAEEVEAADISMGDVPEGDASGYYADAKGVRQPGRYLRYHQNKTKMKAAGRI